MMDDLVFLAMPCMLCYAIMFVLPNATLSVRILRDECNYLLQQA
jgi:hypothetical protein